tara:strand:+ start:1527 stop:1763 length:237 start_codon:yes stop_codon:yes gene_type:complete
MAIVELKECFKCGETDRQEFGQEKQIFKFDWFASIKDRLNQIHGLKVNPEKKVWVCDACIVEHHRDRSEANNYYHIGN